MKYKSYEECLAEVVSSLPNSLSPNHLHNLDNHKKAAEKYADQFILAAGDIIYSAVDILPESYDEEIKSFEILLREKREYLQGLSTLLPEPTLRELLEDMVDQVFKNDTTSKIYQENIDEFGLEIDEVKQLVIKTAQMIVEKCAGELEADLTICDTSSNLQLIMSKYKEGVDYEIGVSRSSILKLLKELQ